MPGLLSAVCLFIWFPRFSLGFFPQASPLYLHSTFHTPPLPLLKLAPLFSFPTTSPPPPPPTQPHPLLLVKRVSDAFIAIPLPLLLLTLATFSFVAPLPPTIPFSSLAFDVCLPISLISSLLSVPPATSKVATARPPPTPFAVYVAFVFVTLASLLASTISQLAFSPSLPIAVCLLSTYIGGAVNFYALAKRLNIPLATMAEYAAVDCGVTLLYLSFMEYAHPKPDPDSDAKRGTDETSPSTPPVVTSLTSIASTINAPLILLLSHLSTRLISKIPSIPPLLSSQSFILSLVILSSLFSKRTRNPASMSYLASLSSQCFYATIALSLGLTRASPAAIVLVTSLQLLHTVFVMAMTKIKPDQTTSLMLASNAAIGGSGTAGLFASNIGRDDLVRTGVFVGMGGYLAGGFLAMLWGWVMVRLKVALPLM